MPYLLFAVTEYQVDTTIHLADRSSVAYQPDPKSVRRYLGGAGPGFGERDHLDAVVSLPSIIDDRTCLLFCSAVHGMGWMFRGHLRMT